MIKIAHISDIHIRRLQYHKEFNVGFDNLVESLVRDSPNLIVCSGDHVHDKTTLSAELVDMLFGLFSRLTRWPTIALLGNHDYNVRNLNKQNIIAVLRERFGSNITIADVTKQTIFPISMPDGTRYVIHAIPANIDIAPIDRSSCDARIAIWHGIVANATTDVGFRFLGDSKTVGDFADYDFGMFGDIHKRQFLSADRRYAYPGSLFQQDFGEEPEKGYLLWTINDRDSFNVEFREVVAGKNFYTFDFDKLTVNPNLVCKCRPNCRLRIRCNEPPTIEQRGSLRKTLGALGVRDIQYRIEPSEATTSNLAVNKERLNNLRNVSVQRELVRAYCHNDTEVMAVHDSIASEVDIGAEQTSDVDSWHAHRIEFENFFAYRGSSDLSLGDREGTIGILGQSKVGKSSIIDILSFALYGQTIRPINKLNEIITKDQESAACTVELEDERGRNLTIKRTLTPFKYYGNKRAGVKQYSKCSTSVTLAGETTTGDDERETRKLISNYIGTFEDFLQLSILSVDRPELSIVGGFDKPTFKDTLRRLLGIDAFDRYELICNQRITTCEQELSSIASQISRSDIVVEEGEDCLRTELERLNKLAQSLRREQDASRRAAECKQLESALRSVPCEQDVATRCALHCAAAKKCDSNQQQCRESSIVRAELSSAEAAIATCNRKLGALQHASKSKESLVKSQSIQEATLKILKRYKEMVGRNGVSLAILKKMLSTWAHLANDVVLSVTSDFQLHVGTDGDAITIDMSDANKQRTNFRTLALGSGTEKLISEISLRLALLQLCKVPRLSMFIVDERLSVLDQQSMEGVLSLFDHMKRFFTHIIVVTHNDDLKDTLEHILEVIKQDGISIIEG